MAGKSKSKLGRQSVMKGKKGQAIALTEMRRIGFLECQEIATPVVYVRTRLIDQIPYHQVAYKERVNGDITAFLPNGVGVVCEVKTKTDGNLTWSIMQKHGEHQATNLDRISKIGVALVAWVCAVDECYLLQWPIPGFGPGRDSISIEDAAKLSIKFLPPWAFMSQNQTLRLNMTE